MSSVGKDAGFLTSMDGIFKGAQFVVSLITLILCSASHYWSVAGAGAMAYVNFVASFCCITLLISAFIYFCKLYNGVCLNRLPWKLLEMAYAGGCAVLYFISMCVSAAQANTFRNTPGDFDELFIACAIFSVIAMVIFLVYGFIIFRGNEPRSAKPRDVST
uniref:Uncharacterized protein LOC100184402 n=1 Tax=Phallusia mammillata TaxID=59560 RepID=A0A6F9DI45_9ASCI|nr:uncharacterized protein LOC100184402 [Phallusia mammillata]